MIMMGLTSDKLYGKATSIADLLNFALSLSKRKQSIFRRRESIPSDSTSLWQISRGIVQVSTLDEDGAFISLGFWGTGDIVGSFLSGIAPYQIECLTDVEAIALQSFDSCSASALLAHARQMEEFLQIIQQRMVKKRLMYFLRWLFSRFGQNTHDGKQLNLHLTHQEIAETIRHYASYRYPTYERTSAGRIFTLVKAKPSVILFKRSNHRHEVEKAD